jgi:hypothetical protein
MKLTTGSTRLMKVTMLMPLAEMMMINSGKE